MFYKIGNWKPSKVPINDLLKATLVLLEMGSMEPRAQVNIFELIFRMQILTSFIDQVLGGVGIFDLEGLTINHGLLITPSVASKIICLMVVSIHITKIINFE